MPSACNASAIASRSAGSPGLTEYRAQSPAAKRSATKRLIGSGVSKLGMPCANETTPGMRLAWSSTSLIGDSVSPRSRSAPIGRRSRARAAPPAKNPRRFMP